MRRHLSFSNVIALVALFAVLGGGAYAASELGKNTVGSKQIKKNAVKTKHVKDAAITTPKLADNAVTGAKADESSFGKVPEAAKADAAITAATATTAGDSQKLNGFDLANVRPFSNTASNAMPVDLNANFSTVLSLTTSPIPSGGADLVVNASVNIENPTPQIYEVQCGVILGDDIEQIGQTAAMEVPGNSIVQLPITGQRNHLTVDPVGGVLMSIKCSDTSGGGNLDYMRGDMVVQAFPDD